MALPVTISGLVHASGSLTVSRPFLSSAGNVYVIGRESTTLGAYKATDPTSSFSSVGTSPSLSVINNINVAQVGDVLHVVTSSGSVTTSVDYKYHTFNMATDAWVVTNESIAAAVDTDASNVSALFVSIGVRSDGDVIVLRHGASARIMGSDFTRVVYDRREGGSWTNSVAVDPGGEVSYTPITLNMGASDRAHFWFANGSSTRHISLSSANALGSVTANIVSSITTTDTAVGQLGTSYVSGANTKIALNRHDNTANDVTGTIAVSEENPTFNTTNDITGASGATVGGHTYSLAADGTTLWGAYIAGDNVQTQSNEDEGGWSAPDTFYDETNAVERLKTNIYTRGGDTVLAMVLEVVTDGIKYHEKLLSAGGPQGDANITLDAVTTTSDGTVSVGGDGSLSVGNITTTADASVSITGNADFTLDAVTTTTDAEPLISGDASLTLVDVTVTGEGTAGFPEIFGEASLALDAVTTTADASVSVTGDASLTLDSVTTTADGSPLVSGDASLTLADVTITGEGDIALEGNASLTLDAVTTTTDAEPLISGDASLTLGDVTTTADGYAATRLYLHDAANSLTGTFPSDEQSTLTPDWTITGASTLRTMNLSKGASQVAKTGSSVATFSLQQVFLGMFTSPPLDGAQTVGATDQEYLINIAGAQSHANMEFLDELGVSLYVWRPSTGAMVGSMILDTASGFPWEDLTTADVERVIENFRFGDAIKSSVTVSAADGDVIILEVWQKDQSQSDSQSFTGTFYYDGTVVTRETGIVSDHASFFEIFQDLAFQAPSELFGNANITLDAVTTTADASVSITGDANLTLDAVTLAADAGVLVIGDASHTLDDVTLASDGGVAVVGDASLTLDAVTVIGEGTVIEGIVGNADLTLDDVTVSATGSVTDPVVVIQRGGDDAPPRRRKVPASDKPNPDKVLERRMEETLDDLVNPKPPVELTSEDAPAVGQTASALASALLPLYTLPKQRVIRPGRMRAPKPLSDEEMIILLLMVM